MKKKFLFGLIALLSVSFIFFGCGDSGGGGGGLGGDDAAVAAGELAENLATLLDDAGDPLDVHVDGAVVTVGASFTLSSTLPENPVIVVGVTLALADNVTLTAEKNLTVNGTVALGTGASVKGDTDVTIIIGPNGSVSGGDNFYDEDGDPLETVTAGTTYEWDAVLAGGNGGWKVQVPPLSETWSDTADYPVKDTAALYTSTLTVTSAEESSLGNVRIVLGGTIPADVAYKAGDSSYTAWTNAWSDPADLIEGFTPEPGNYGSFAFIGAFPANPDELDIVIKQTNDALRYNTGWTSRVSDTPLTAPVVKADEKSMYLGEIAYRWRTYDGTKVPATEDLSVLLWSEATDKTITLEIQSVDGTIPLKTITIDYSTVKFETNVASVYPKTGQQSAYPSDLSPDGLNIVSAKRDDVTGIVTFKLNGNIASTYRYDSDGSSSPASSSSNWANQWSNPDGTFTPLEGKYGSFIFDGAFADTAGLNIVMKQTNDALLFYTGWDERWSAAELTVPATSMAMPNGYIVSGDVIRWVTYGTNVIPPTDNMAVLLWSGATNKTITLEIQSFTGSNDPAVEGTDYDVLSKFVIDYSDVTFND